MDFAIIKPDEQFSNTKPFKAKLLSLKNMFFDLYTFEPWQRLSMRRHPGSDTLLYCVSGDGIIFVDDEERSLNEYVAVGIPVNTPYAMLARDNVMTVISINSPAPADTVLLESFSYDCPACGMMTPVTTNTYDGCITKCPRCHVVIRLRKEEGGFSARTTDEPAPASTYVE